MLKKDLDKVLSDHDLWVRTEGAEGVKASLNGANLIDANLEGVNLSGTKGVLSGTFGRHLAVAFCFEGVRYIKIGCKTETVSVWLENFVSVGKKHGYSETEINLYGSFIEFVSKVPNSVFKG